MLGGHQKRFVRYADADWALQDYQHSILVYIFQIDGTVSWSYQKQSIVTLPSTKATSITLMQPTKEVLCMLHFIMKYTSLLDFWWKFALTIN